MEYQVALCGLTDHKAHLIQLVISAAPRSKFKFQVGQPESLEWVDIAIVETTSSVSSLLLEQIRRRNPDVVVVYVSDHGLSGDSRFRIARRSLLLQIQRLLEQVVDEGILSEKVRALNARPLVAREPVVVSPRVAGVPQPRGEGAIVPPVVPRAAPSQAGQLLALVVDDSATVRAQARAALQRAGIECREAEDAEQAMTLLTQSRFDLALFDVIMPGVDGYELCRRVKRDPRMRAMPVLMLTSRSSPFDRARGALVGCDSYLVKPIAWDSFYQAIDKALSKAFRNDRSAMAARGFRDAGSALPAGAGMSSVKER